MNLSTIEMDLCEVAISWETSSTITLDNHFLLTEASDVVFASYKVNSDLQTF